jgi:ABC-type molybdate transport system permease subunit
MTVKQAVIASGLMTAILACVCFTAPVHAQSIQQSLDGINQELHQANQRQQQRDNEQWRHEWRKRNTLPTPPGFQSLNLDGDDDD